MDSGKGYRVLYGTGDTEFKVFLGGQVHPEKL